MKQKQAYPHAPGVTPEDEIALMALIASGDKGAFTIMMDRHLTGIYRFAYSIVNNRVTAEDIAQETCLRLWENAGRWHPPGRVRSWLLRIAHNLAIDALRGTRLHAEIGDYEDVLSSREPGPRLVLQMRQTSERLSGALFDLPERQRTALMLVYYAECGQGEASAIMGITVEALESLIARGKQNLRMMQPGLRDLLEGHEE